VWWLRRLRQGSGPNRARGRAPGVQHLAQNLGSICRLAKRREEELNRPAWTACETECEARGAANSRDWNSRLLHWRAVDTGRCSRHKGFRPCDATTTRTAAFANVFLPSACSIHTERIKISRRCDYTKPQRQMPVRFRQDVQRLLWKAEVTVSGQMESGQPPSERPDSASLLLQGRFLEEPLMKTRKSVKKKYGESVTES
jgi:hypothetical protein